LHPVVQVAHIGVAVNLEEDLHGVRERLAPQPRHAQPEAGHNLRVVNAVFVRCYHLGAPLRIELVELSLFELWFADAEVLAELERHLTVGRPADVEPGTSQRNLLVLRVPVRLPEPGRYVAMASVNGTS
jgi:hypothetical protein